jgi:hypothetical protein
MCERNHPENWHLKRFVPLYLAGLLMVAACGAPDEVKRVSVQTSGETAGSGGGSGSESVSTSSSSSPGGSATGGVSSAAPTSSVVTGGKVGGTTASGGKGGTSVSSKGGTGAGGNTANSAKSSSAGASGGATTYPTVGGRSGGATTVGGRTSSAGGTGGTTSSASDPPPADGLAAYLTQKPSGSSGQLGLALQVVNATSKSIDLSSVILRYWYQDKGEGLGETAALEIDDARVGDSTSVKDKVTGIAVADPSPVTGADHYLQISFSSGVTLAAKGTSGNADRLTLGGRLHNASYKGTVDATNDYSYNDGATGYNKRITFHDKAGTLISGTLPGAGSTLVSPPEDAGAVDTNADR